MLNLAVGGRGTGSGYHCPGVLLWLAGFDRVDASGREGEEEGRHRKDSTLLAVQSVHTTILVDLMPDRYAMNSHSRQLDHCVSYRDVSGECGSSLVVPLDERGLDKSTSNSGPWVEQWVRKGSPCLLFAPVFRWIGLYNYEMVNVHFRAVQRAHRSGKSISPGCWQMRPRECLSCKHYLKCTAIGHRLNGFLLGPRPPPHNQMSHAHVNTTLRTPPLGFYAPLLHSFSNNTLGGFSQETRCGIW